MKQSMKQTLKRSLIAGCLLGLGACAPDIELVPVTASPSQETRFIATERAGGSLGLEITAPRGFRVLGEETAVRSLKLYLVSGNSGNQRPELGPFVLETDKLNEDGKTQFVSFHNVPAGAYYVAAAAFDGAGGSGNNLTADTEAGHIRVLDNGPEDAYVTTEGGEGGAFPGRITVNPNLSITGSAQLKLRLYVQGGEHND